MFNFGDPKEIAQLHLDVAKEDTVFNSEADLMKMPIEELREHLVTTRIAYKEARRGFGAQEASDMLLEMYDDAFEAMCRRSSGFRGIVLNNKHVYINGYIKQQVVKYKGIAYAAKKWARSNESAN